MRYNIITERGGLKMLLLLIVLSFITFLFGIICRVMWHKNNKDILFNYYRVCSWFLFAADIGLIILLSSAFN